MKAREGSAFRLCGEPRLAILLALAVILGFALRLAPLGRYVTPDEPAWVYRSIQFGDVLTAGDWASVPNTGHPGVTTMWLGAAGVFGRRLFLPQDSLGHLEWVRRIAWLAPENGEAFRHLAPFLGWGRAAVALVTVGGLIALVPLLAPVFGRTGARLTAMLLLLDPFLIGHSGLLHTDALLATFCMLALAAALRGALQSDGAIWWAVSGLLSGLAALTKTPGLILIFFIPALLAVICVRREGDPWRSVLGRGLVLSGRVLLFGVCFSAAYFVLYPAMWVRAGAIVETLTSFGSAHIQMAQRPIFFAGRETYDPGLVFYPAVFLFRISPLTLFGLVVALTAWRRLSSDRRFAFAALLVFAVLFATLLSLGAKKHDRYLLPALPPVTLAAVLGATEALKQDGETRAKFPAVGVVMVQALLAGVFAAYPLRYANPLAGGPAVAARVLRFEWGEGAGAAARYLNRLPDVSELTVAASNVPSFASMFEGHAVPLDDDAHALAVADYVVGGTANTSFSDLRVFESIEAVAGGGTVVYTNTVPLELGDYLSARAQPEDLILLDAETPLQRGYRGAGTLLSVASVDGEASMADWLAGHIASYERVWQVASEAASPITAQFLERQLQAVAQPEGSATLPTATITAFVPRPSDSTPKPSPYVALFGGRLELLGAFVQEQVAWPDRLEVVVRWRARAALACDCRAVVALRDQQGHTWTLAEFLVRNEVYFPTSAWEPEDWADARYALALPSAIPPGDYSVEVSLHNEATGAQLGAVGPDGTFRGTRVPIGVARIARPHQSPERADFDLEESVATRVGPFTLLEADLEVEEARSGDYLPLHLLWRADAPPVTDYQIRLELFDQENQTDLSTTQPLSLYPTSFWEAGDRFASHHRLRITPTLPAGRYQLQLYLVDPGSSTPVGDPIRVGTVRVLLGDRSFDRPDTELPSLDVTFGETIQLCGYDVQEKRVALGDSLSLSLWWCANEAIGGPDGSYTLYVHLMGPDGVVHGQVDRTPGNGKWPTSSWAPGQVIEDQIELPLEGAAPVGPYQIALGFYDPAYGDRLPVTVGTGAVASSTELILPLDITVEGGGQ